MAIKTQAFKSKKS